MAPTADENHTSRSGRHAQESGGIKMVAAPKIKRSARLVWLVIVALLTVVGVVTLPSAAGAQDDASGE